MAKLLAIGRKVAIVGRRFVTDAGGAPCCCGPGGGCCRPIFIVHCNPTQYLCCPPDSPGQEYDFRVRQVGGGAEFRTPSITPGIIEPPNGLWFDSTIDLDITVRVRCVGNIQTVTVDPASRLYARTRVWDGGAFGSGGRYATTEINAVGAAAAAATLTPEPGFTPWLWGFVDPSFDPILASVIGPAAFGGLGVLIAEMPDCVDRIDASLPAPDNLVQTITRETESDCSGGTHRETEQLQANPYLPGTQQIMFTRVFQSESRSDWSFTPLSVCPSDPCAPPEPIGACCRDDTGPDDNPCFATTAADCAAVGGTYRGDGSNCQTTPCPPVWRCCLPDGSCEHLPEWLCRLRGGTWARGVNCNTPCPSDPVVACCFNDGTCADTTLSQCLAAGGTSFGANRRCVDAPCDVGPRGACCIGDRCESLTEAACGARGGIWRGPLVPCLPTTCPRVTQPDPDDPVGALNSPGAADILRGLIGGV